jgi:NTE family protein
MIYDTLCLSGGGTSGISTLGSLKILENYNFYNYKKINNFYGTSVGSIICFFLIIKYSIDDIINFIDKFNFDNLDQKANAEIFLKNYGLNTGSRLVTIIQTFLYEKFKLKDITFFELYKKTNKNFGVVGTNITKNREELFSYKNTPNMSVIKAIRISISIPFVFTIVEHNNFKYTDGGLVNNFPINYCNSKTTIGINLVSSKDNNCNTFLYFLIGIKNVIYKLLSTYNKYSVNHVIEIGNSNDNKDNVNKNIEQNIYRYKINDYQKDILFRKGYYQTLKFCKNSIVLISFQIIQEIINSI